MKKRVTIHDIAREAGVSAATVSYVINNRTDQSISEETKQKIWHIINLLNYEPNVFAKNLRSAPSSKFIAIYGNYSSPIYQAEYVNILNGLKNFFAPSDYGIIFGSRPYSKVNFADAIIAYNLTLEEFHEIGNLNFIPLVAADCLVNDKVFFQVTTDYAKLNAAATEHFGGDFTFVSLLPADAGLKTEIDGAFARYKPVAGYSDLAEACKGRIATCDKVVCDFARSAGTDVYFSEECYSRKQETIFQCIKKALSREKYDEHFFKV